MILLRCLKPIDYEQKSLHFNDENKLFNVEELSDMIKSVEFDGILQSQKYVFYCYFF
jgi:hypothetical protein